MKFKILKAALSLGLAWSAVGCATKPAKVEAPAEPAAVLGTEAEAQIVSGKKKIVVTFKQVDSMTIEASIKASGLKKNEVHGLHIHEGTLCEGPDFKSAGGHFNPHKKEHGSPSQQSHAGDLGNIEGGKKGKFEARVTLTQVQVASGEMGILGRSLILHAKADDLKTQPSGDSGDRVGCALINLKK